MVFNVGFAVRTPKQASRGAEKAARGAVLCGVGGAASSLCGHAYAAGNAQIDPVSYSTVSEGAGAALFRRRSLRRPPPPLSSMA